MQRLFNPLIGLIALLLTGAVSAQALYKYRGPDGEWIFTDREPAAEVDVEVRNLPVNASGGTVSLTRHTADGRAHLLANNTLHTPVQLVLLPPSGDGRPTGKPLEWLLPPLSQTELQSFDVAEPAAAPEPRYIWLPGDPASRHEPDAPYRAPYPAAVSHPVSQAWPDMRTHTTSDSFHAIDIAMPIGSNVHAARGGIVIQVASTNYRSSDTLDGEGSSANLVRILHDDGTFAIYAHLNWNSIRVRPGQRVARGEYIADSGNTGFSSGPHLHFVVVRNAGMRIVSVPVEFATATNETINPVTGMQLTAY